MFYFSLFRVSTFEQLSLEDNIILEAPFLEEEVNEVVFNNDDDKILGPGGFNIGFFKACWKVVKDDVCGFVNEFHSVGKFPKEVTTCFLL